MITFASGSLPSSEIVYAAFRIAFLDTRERLELAHQLDVAHERNFGYLIEVPFLRNVPAQVQLDCLTRTWQRHTSTSVHTADLLDESVLYAACETAAIMVKREPTIVQRFLANGPQPFTLPVDAKLADKFQRMHVEVDSAGHYLLISQFLDIPPDEAAPLKLKYGLDPNAAECLFDALGQWYVTPDLLDRASGILTDSERRQSTCLFRDTVCHRIK